MVKTGRFPRLAVLGSGRGTNFSALCRAAQAGELGAEVVLAVSDREDAGILERARNAGVEACYLPPRVEKGNRTAPDFDRALLALLDEHRIDLVALAGFMRLVSSRLVAAYRWRMLNIHPSLLPAFPGLNAVARALEAGVKISGCTVHFVDEGMDTGPIVLQEAVPVKDDDDVDTLTARIQAAEHRIYPQAVRWLAEGRLQVKGRRVSVLAASGDRVDTGPSMSDGMPSPQVSTYLQKGADGA